MGVPGLWDILRPAATRHSLSHLAREAVFKNANNLRALTIGIDASIWIFHAQVPHQGENPFLRTIFYKITALLQQPVLPVFVFDGPDKPGQKRNQRVGGSFGTSDARSRQFKELLDECGLEWWNAPGEAEAELAVMNRQGKIDAVLSDDVDALLFGALCLLRNNSPTLSGAQGGSSTKTDQRSYDVYRATAVRELMTSREGTKLVTDEDCRMAMVLIALLAGGDYVPEGLESFGPTIAHGLAHAGFIDILKLYKSDYDSFKAEMNITHAKMMEELKTDASGMIGRRNPARATTLAALDPSTLFSRHALEAYLNPSSSPLHDPKAGWPGFGAGERSIRRGKARNGGRGDLEGFARACERFFEWGTKEIVVKRFASETVGLFGSEIMNAAREAMRLTAVDDETPSSAPPASQSHARSADNGITAFFPEVRPSSQRSSGKAAGARLPATLPSEPLSNVIKINSTREDPTSPGDIEYRITYNHSRFTERIHAAMHGGRIDPKELDAQMRAELGLKDKEEDETAGATAAVVKDEQRVWIGDYLVRSAWPMLVEQYEEEIRAKQAKKTAGPRRNARSGHVGAATKGRKKRPNQPVPVGMDAMAFKHFFTQPADSVPTPPSVSPSLQSSARSSSQVSVVSEDSDSSIELIELVSPKTASGRITQAPRRHHPTSSISSSSSIARPPISTPSPPVRKTRSSVKKVSPRHARSPSNAGRVKAKSTEPVDVIDLCSSDDATPRPRRAAPLRPSTTVSSTCPRLDTRRQSRSPKKKTKAPMDNTLTGSQSVQTRLDLPLLGPGSQSRTPSKPVKKKSPVKADKDDTGGATRQKTKREKYRCVILSESEELIEIDVVSAR